MRKTEAFVLRRFGNPEQAFRLETVELPDLQDGEVLIENEGFGLNYADVMARNGLYRETPPLPCVLGYEVAGKIIEAGINVPESWKEKRVVAFTRFGGYAKHSVVKLTSVAEIGDLPAETAMALATQGVTALYMVDRAANVQKDDCVLIHAAAGGVGSLLIQLCKMRGAHVIAKVSSAEKASFVSSLGADAALNYREKNYAAEIGEQQLDISFNPVGGDTFPIDLSLLRAGGRVVLFGGSALKKGGWKLFNGLNFVRKMKLLVPIALMMRSRGIIGVNMLKIGDERPDLLGQLLRESVELNGAGKIVVTSGGKFSSEQLFEAHKLLESGSSIGKISVIWK